MQINTAQQLLLFSLSQYSSPLSINRVAKIILSNNSRAFFFIELPAAAAGIGAPRYAPK